MTFVYQSISYGKPTANLGHCGFLTEQNVYIRVQLKGDMYEIQVSSGLKLTVQEANSELCCRNLKKLATEKRRQ